MRLPFGLEFTRKQAGSSPVYDNRGSWWPWIHEPYTGAWQRNDTWTADTVLAYNAVFACITLIAQDVGKLRPKLVEQDANGIWTETTSAAFSPVLRKPNAYQNHIQFKEWWIISKLIRGNTYALKERDNRGVVRRLYLLDPGRVKVLIAPDGSVYYELAQDNLSGLEKGNVSVPASEIIHDRVNCIFHPLVGVSPIFACGTAANVGLKIQNSSANFFGKGAQPSGIITTPTGIDKDVQDRIANHWNTQFSGANAGRVAVLGNNMKFEPMTMKATDSQLIEQLKWTAETVCSVFHVPPFKIGIGAPPSYPNASAILNQIYYSDCLQSHIETFELVMDEGLGIGEGSSLEGGKILGVELDVEEGLLRMDQGTLVTTLAAAIGGTIMAPNEGRRKLHLKPVKGGDDVLSQQQNFSLAALHERDQDDPFSKPALPTPAPQLALPPGKPADDSAEKQAAALARTALLFRKHLYAPKVAA